MALPRRHRGDSESFIGRNCCCPRGDFGTLVDFGVSARILQNVAKSVGGRNRFKIPCCRCGRWCFSWSVSRSRCRARDSESSLRNDWSGSCLQVCMLPFPKLRFGSESENWRRHLDHSERSWNAQRKQPGERMRPRVPFAVPSPQTSGPAMREKVRDDEASLPARQGACTPQRLPGGDSSLDCNSLMSKSLAHRLAEFSCSLNFEDLSPEVVHEVKRRVIDSFGCALGAWNEEPCVIARKVASDFSAKNGGTIIGTDHQAPPDWAAFATGCCIRYFDYNDTYLSKEPAHPSDNIAAALAVAESVGANGRELITAIALAYEVQCRFCDAASIRARGWDHPTYGAFSTALAAAKLMKLDPENTRHAVNIAGVAGAAMRQARVGELSHWKGVAFATAARHGVFSALLARAGMTGPGPIFEGQMGFEKQLGVTLGNVGEKFVKRPDARTANEGTAAMILNTSIKYWPAEYHSQSANEAALFRRPRLIAR